MKKITTRYLSGVELRLPVDRRVLSMVPWEQDEWAVAQLRKAHIKPRAETHFRKVYEGNAEPVALVVMSYDYTI